MPTGKAPAPEPSCPSAVPEFCSEASGGCTQRLLGPLICSGDAQGCYAITRKSIRWSVSTSRMHREPAEPQSPFWRFFLRSRFGLLSDNLVGRTKPILRSDTATKKWEGNRRDAFPLQAHLGWLAWATRGGRHRVAYIRRRLRFSFRTKNRHRHECAGK